LRLEINPLLRVGYHFIVPFIVPVRQNVAVRVRAAETLPEAVTCRIHLFGLQVRETG
jgi:hypothetical protein